MRNLCNKKPHMRMPEKTEFWRKNMSCFKQTLLTATMAAILAACSGDDIDRDFTNADFEPLTTEQPTIVVEISENDDITRVDLAQNINNSSGRTVSIINLDLAIIDEDGDGEVDKRPQTNGDGSVKTDPATGEVLMEDAVQEAPPYIRSIRQYGQPGYTVLDRYEAGILQDGLELVVQPFTWTDELKYGEEKEYKYDYFLSNTYNDGDFDFEDDYLKRTVIVKVTGAEDPVTDIEIVEGDTIKVPQGYDTAVTAQVFPDFASLPELVWTSADESIATVTSVPDDPDTPQNESLAQVVKGIASNGAIDAVVKVTASLKDGINKGSVYKEFDVVVSEFPSGPVGVEIQAGGQTKAAIPVALGIPFQLTAKVLPEDPNSGIDRTVMWESLNTDIATVDQNTGLVTIVNRYLGPVEIQVKTLVDNRISVIKINPKANPNYIYELNGDFESGEKTPWIHKWGTLDPIITVSADAARDGNYGLHLQAKDNGTTTGGLLLKENFLDPMLPNDFADGSRTGDKARTFQLTWDMKVNNFVAGENQAHTAIFFPNGSNWQIWKGGNKTGPVTSGDWQTYVHEFVEPDNWVGLADVRLVLQFAGTVGDIDAYYDNIKMTCIKNCD
ncbi:hypothetical protein C2869_04140 [Saccharobesus litoralis]|uniref:BIG2 domain-containing protein n=1 Tax=Saccharobesus litoralis TaxID=2172099 RepID=A0A2S0VN97_9ALTE|nr:Ig-like domain-containing protein [Saccharobesus litoralis]AWB65676.1 hypothetical protein C2869_04140 [Saccharobesus litoralis]